MGREPAFPASGVYCVFWAGDRRSLAGGVAAGWWVECVDSVDGVVEGNLSGLLVDVYPVTFSNNLVLGPK